MKQTSNESKLPSTSYRQTYRRHRKLLCVPVILGVLASAFFVFSSSKSYESTASLWVDTAAPLASSVGAGLGAQLPVPPASAEQGILTELLTTQSFATSVAKSSLLGKALGSPASIQKNAATYLQDGQVVPAVTGEQVLRISYTASSPTMAQSVLNAIVTQLRSYSNGLTARHGQAAEAYDRQQVKLAQSALAAARNDVNTYLAQHPQANQADPNLLSLTSAENNAVTQLGQANITLSQATGTSNQDGWSIQVIDPADAGIAPALGKKKMLEVIIGGAFGGVLLSFLIVVAMTPAKKEEWEDELPLGKPFISDVPPADPFQGQLHVPTAVTHGASEASHDRALSNGKRRFVRRGLSEQRTDDR